MAEVTWNGTFQELYDRAKKIVKKHVCVKFYVASIPLYLETDASGVGQEVGLLQVGDGMNCRFDEVPDNEILCQLLLLAKAYHALSDTIAIKNVRPLEYCLG